MLRCSQCGAEVSAWAASCPACRNRLDAVSDPGAPSSSTAPGAAAGAPGPGPGAGATRRGPRRRANLPRPSASRTPSHASAPTDAHTLRVPPAFILIACAALGLVVTLWISQSHRHTRSSTQVLGTQTTRTNPGLSGGSELAGYTLLYADGGTDVVLAPFGGSRHALATLPATGYPEQPVRTGGGAVVISKGVAYALGPSVTGSALAIGPADHLYPVEARGAVGVYRAGSPGSPATVRLITLAPRPATATVADFPKGYLPVAGLPSGILSTAPAQGGLLQVWKPSTGGNTGIFTMRLGGSGGVVGIAGNRVAWVSSMGCNSLGECPLHITDAATGRDVIVSPPPGYGGYLPGGSFSPDNPSLLAAFVSDPINKAAGARLVLISLVPVGASHRWTPALVPQGSVLRSEKSPPSATWTPDGAHILFCGDPSGLIHDYRPGEVSSYATEHAGSASFTVLLNSGS